MSGNGRKISSSRWIMGGIAVVVALWICGCGDFFATKPTELQSQSIIGDLSQVREVPDLNTPLPDIYLTEPKIMEGKDGVKLFYFTKHHTVEEFAGFIRQDGTKTEGLIQEQFGYTVSQNPATNQLIVKCPTREEAEMVLEFLKEVDVPPIQIKIDCLISEIYADKTLDWETTIEISDLFGEDITLGGSARPFGQDVSELIQEGAILPAFPGASLREVARAKMGLKIGYAHENFLAMVDLLESRGYLKVLMNPTLEVINGRKAKILTSEHVPLPKEVITKEITPYMTTEYKDVIDSLEITPHAFADGSIGLETKAMISSKNIPEGVKQIPILTKREIAIEENRIRPGESLVIGGMRKSEERSVVRGVPILKDIPLLGILFSSKDFEERAKEVVFIITPSISSGGIPHKDMVEQIRRKHEPPVSPETLQEAITDPSGLEALEQEHQRKVLQAEQERVEAEVEKTKARLAVREADEQVKKAEAEAREAAAEVEKARAQAEKAKTRVDKLKVELEKSKAETDKAKAEAEKAREEAERAKEETEKSKAEDANEASG